MRIGVGFEGRNGGGVSSGWIKQCQLLRLPPPPKADLWINSPRTARVLLLGRQRIMLDILHAT
jgi:hypothetical protein